MFLPMQGQKFTLTSPKGKKPPIDPSSTTEDAQTEATKRFDADAELTKKTFHDHKNWKILILMIMTEYSIREVMGRFGIFANDLNSIALIEEFNDK